MSIRRALASVLTALALTACGSAPESPASPPSPAATSPRDDAFQRYVALGDSYSAAPYVPLSDLAGGCVRSDHNYPHLLARSLPVRTLVDVTCGGATTADVTGPQTTFLGQRIAAQGRALGPRTDLVTVGLGGNDFGIFGRLAATCPRTGPQGRRFTAPRGVRCGEVPADLAVSVPGVEAHLVRTLRRIRRLAPRATVVLVGYPRLLTPGGRRCSALPVPPAAESGVDALSRGLRDAMAAAARRTRVRFVDLYAASAGHEVCSARPWVNGIRFDERRAASLHPFPVEQRAVARLVRRALRGAASQQ